MLSVEQFFRPLDYHIEMRDYLKSQEKELWNWFSSAQAKANYTEKLRLDLLKSTYRLDPDGHAEFYKALAEVKTELQLEMPVTLYQAQQAPQSNVTLFFIPGEGHIVFSGPVLTLLSTEEIKSVIGHELAHYHLWERENGEFHIADRLLLAIGNDPRATSSHEQTARRFQLYTEIYADRGSLCVTKHLDPVISGLVKVETGLAQVSAQGYLKQAEEVFAKGNVLTEGVSHPEAFIRARALAMWQDQPEAAAGHIRSMIEGAEALDDLDILGQQRMSRATRGLLEYFLQPKWIQSPAVLGHAKLFFDDFSPSAKKDAALLEGLKFSDPKLREYICYVLLDFVAADPELDEMPLAAALELCRSLELNQEFEKIAAKELKIKARDMKRIKEQAAQLLAKVEVTGE